LDIRLREMTVLVEQMKAQIQETDYATD